MLGWKNIIRHVLIDEELFEVISGFEALTGKRRQSQ
jgi:hypothetical protein